MARAPINFDSDEDDMDALRRERQEQFNRFIGCAFMLGIAALGVVLIIGFWATH